MNPFAIGHLASPIRTRLASLAERAGSNRSSGLLGRFRRSEGGVAAIEFGLLGTLLMAMLAGFLDVSYMVRARQYSDRASVLVARALTTCAINSSCTPVVAMSQINNAKANLFLRYPAAEIGMATIQRTDGAVTVCVGTMTYLESDVMTTAKNILKDDDSGVAVYIKTSYTTFFPGYIAGYFASAGGSNGNSSTGANVTFRDYTVDVIARNRPCL